MFGLKFVKHLKTLITSEINQTGLHVQMKMITGSERGGVVLGLTNKLLEMSQNKYLQFSSAASPSNRAENIVWVDMEMTGLDPDKDHVLEVACLVTDSQLNIIAEGPDLAVHQPPHVLEKMNEWCIKHHRESGLSHMCQTSEVSLRDAEIQLLDFVRAWTPFKKCPLAGNTIYMDRLFLMKHMPEFEQHMHYRIIDVSSVKELCSRWYPDIYIEQPNKKEESKHRAQADIKCSVDELKFYRKNIFRKAEVGEAMGMTWC